MPTLIVLRRRAKARFILAFRPGPQIALIAILSMMVVAAGIAHLAPPDPQTWAPDIASP